MGDVRRTVRLLAEDGPVEAPWAVRVCAPGVREVTFRPGEGDTLPVTITGLRVVDEAGQRDVGVARATLCVSQDVLVIRNPFGVSVAI